MKVGLLNGEHRLSLRDPYAVMALDMSISSERYVRSKQSSFAALKTIIAKL